jgi:quercetin dioxygenase-like cupin family protein
MTTQQSHIQPVVRQDSDAERRWFYGGGIHTWKLTHAESGGAFSLLEDDLTKGKTTPLHSHADSDELLYVIEGELLMSIDGQERRLGAGGVAMVPRGMPHALLVVSDRARILAIMTSPHTEAFFRAASEPGDTGPVDFARVKEAAVQTGGMVMLGPPPFAKP